MRNIQYEQYSIRREPKGYKKKRVSFADGIIPGYGTSASENSSAEDELNLIKPKKLSSRRQRKKAKDSSYLMYGKEPLSDSFGKENVVDKKVRKLRFNK